MKYIVAKLIPQLLLSEQKQHHAVASDLIQTTTSEPDFLKKVITGGISGSSWQWEEPLQELRLLVNPDQYDNLSKALRLCGRAHWEKPVGSLARIGEVLGKKLEERGFDKAYVVLGQFLVLDKDEDIFWEWLKDTCGTNAKQSQDCFRYLRGWYNTFL